MTLTKQAMALARNEVPGRSLAVLRKYVREYNQYESGEVAKIIAVIEEAADPEHIKRSRRVQAKSDASRAEYAEECKAATERAWLPGGKSWNDAIRNAEINGRVLFHAAEIMRSGEPNRHLVKAMRAFDDGGIWSIERGLPTSQRFIIRGGVEHEGPAGFVAEPPQKAPQHSQIENVIDGPWAS